MSEVDAISSPAPATPWQGDPGPIPKPAHGGAYGYFVGGKFSRCTRYELLERCMRPPLPDAVWTPEGPHLVAPGHSEMVRTAVLRARPALEIGRPAAVMGGGAAALLVLGIFGVIHIAGGIIIGFILGVAAVALAAVRMHQHQALRERIERPVELVSTPEGEYEAWVGGQSAVVTTGLVAGLAVLALLQWITGAEESIAAAALVKPDVRGGEWWRLLTGALLHASLLHIWFNATALLAFGQKVEVHAGRAYVPGVFLVTALGGSLASTLLLPDGTTVGASGGVLGLLGFLLMLHRRRPGWFPGGSVKGIWTVIAINAGIGTVGWAIIDNAAHAGGLLAGVALGALLPLRDGPDVHGQAPARWVEALGAASAAILLGAALFTAFRLIAA